MMFNLSRIAASNMAITVITIIILLLSAFAQTKQNELFDTF
jgi:hypothetical protein